VSPYEVEPGVADAVMEVVAFVIVKLVVADDPS
jgi:hypothetical protein